MTSIFSFSLLLFTLAATPVLAESPRPAENRIVVATADLDLGSVSGQRQLDRRLANAVFEACGTAPDFDLAGKNDVRRCRDETTASMKANRDRLVELASRSGPIEIAVVR
jgi:UrcA family protein